MGTYHKDLDDQAVEKKAVDLSYAEGRDPFAMTYINDDGIVQPYGPGWAWYVDEAVDQLLAKSTV